METSLSQQPALTEVEAKRRLAAAVRRGTPSWLWEDVWPGEWQAALDEIAGVTREILATGSSVASLKGAAGPIGIAAYTSGMGPLLGYWIGAGLVDAPADTRELLELHYRHNVRRMETMTNAAREVVSRLAEAGIKVTVLKVMQSASTHFPSPGARPSTDVVLYIAPADKPLAEELLRQLDYTPEAERRLPDERSWRHRLSTTWPQSLSLVHWNDPWDIDVHTSVNRRSAAGAPVIGFDDLIARGAVTYWAVNPSAAALSPPAEILFLAAHAGYTCTNLRLIRLVELALAIRSSRRDGGEGVWREIVELGEETGTLGSAYPALALTEALVPGEIPYDVLENCRGRTPATVVEVIRDLSPATGHRILRCDVRERYMWSTSLWAKIKQLLHDLVPAEQPLGAVWSIYKIRFWRVVRRRLAFRSSSS